MSTSDNSEPDNAAENRDESAKSRRALMTEDIHDSPEDEEKMKSETVIIDLPDVSDIPGQENIVVPRMEEMYDTTISSDDEEGVGLFGDDEEDEDLDLVMGNEADVTGTEQVLLGRADEEMPDEDDSLLRKSALDNQDKEGEALNVGSLTTDVSGGDLDMSGVDADDAMEAIGEEDEENNAYSLGGDRNDNVTEDKQ